MPTTTERRSQLSRRTETYALVLESACQLFGEKGYSDTSLEDIARLSGLTIRPVYHYFGNKKNLFTAAAEKLELELAQALAEGLGGNCADILAGKNPPPVQLDQAQLDPALVKTAWQTFLRFSQNPPFRQIVLIDVPNILGKERWNNNPVILLAKQMIRQLQPGFSDARYDLISRMLIAALAEAALMSAETKDTDLFTDVGDWLHILFSILPTRNDAAE